MQEFERVNQDNNFPNFTQHLSSQHHSFDITLATVFGVHGAILIHHFQHWIQINRRLKRNFRDGRTWTYQTHEEIAAHFPYLTGHQIRHAIDKLVSKGVLLKGNYNRSITDRTLWYAFADEGSLKEIPQVTDNLPICENSQMDWEISQLTPDTKTADTKAASKHACNDAFALLADLPFNDDEKKSFAASFNADQCKRAVAFHKAKIEMQPDFTPGKGWLPFLAAAIHQNWPIPEKPIKSSADPKTLVDAELNASKANSAFVLLEPKIDIVTELLSIYKDHISYRHRVKDITIALHFNDKEFDQKLDFIRKTILNKR